MPQNRNMKRESNSKAMVRDKTREVENTATTPEAEVTVIELEQEEKEEQESNLQLPLDRNNREETLRFDPNSVEQLQPTRGHALGWRKQLRGSLDFPNLTSPKSRRNGRRGNNTNNYNNDSNTSSRSPPKVLHSARYQRQSSSPLKPFLEKPEEQLEMYHSLQKREFATLHEELQYLRMTYIHSQKTLRLKSEEITRLYKELEEKSKEIDRLKALLSVIRKKRFLASGSNKEDEDILTNSSNSGRIEVTPSLALFAATASGISNTNNNTTGRGPPAKMLLELRQNIASRDTVIDTLRMELASLRKEKKEADEQIRTTAAELEKAQAQCVALTADLTAKDARIEELGRRYSTYTITSSTAMNNMDNKNNKDDNSSKSNDGDTGYLQHQFEEYQRRYRATDEAIGNIQQQLQRLERNALSVPSNNGSLESQQQQQQRQQREDEQQEFLRNELMQLRRCLEREKETTAETERQWRRKRETDLRRTETELDTARAETEAYKREVARMQKQLTTASFAEAQLQAARNENDALQQRVMELREENTAQASRERELRNEMRITKEAYERREEEVASLQRRLKASRDSETALREEIETLETRLAHFEERSRNIDRSSLLPMLIMKQQQQQQHKGSIESFVHASAPYDLSSYAALMELNANLQDRVEALEMELEETKATILGETAAETTKAAANLMIPKLERSSKDIVQGKKDDGEVMHRIDKLATEVEAFKSGLQHTGASLRMLQEQFVSSVLRGENKNPQKQSILKGEIEANEGIHTELKSTPSRKRHNVEIIRDQLQNLQHHQQQQQPQNNNNNNNNNTRLMKVDVHQSSDRNTEIDKLQDETHSLRKLLSDYEEELKRVRRELVIANAEVNTMRHQNKLLCDTTLNELRNKCEEQERLITILRESTSMTNSSSLYCGKKETNCDSEDECDEDRIIEEALRQETARLDEEMNALRREVQTARVERDHWKALAKAATKKDHNEK